MILNVIGCGNVGTTLCRLWHQSGTFILGSVLNRSMESARSAAEFIGAGTLTESYAQMMPAEIYLVGTPDDGIEDACAMLVAAGVLRPGDIVFHCSGSLPSSVLSPARSAGAHLASVHPIHSFADPVRSVERFAGTFCALEGDPEALGVLRQAFSGIGAEVFEIDGRQKRIYHAATVIACNYLVALLEVSLRCLEQSGIVREQALSLLQPIVTATVDNVFALDTVRALTGPIARGDHQVVARQWAALQEWDPSIAALYGQLGRVAVSLSGQQGSASAEALRRIQDLFDEHSGQSNTAAAGAGHPLSPVSARSTAASGA